jgi:hypothetical protein
MPYLQFMTEDGVTILVETASPASGPGPRPASRIGDAMGTAVSSLESALVPIKKAAATLTAQIRDAFPERPDELTVSFAATASLEVNGLILAKSGAEGCFTVSATWNKGEGAPRGDAV